MNENTLELVLFSYRQAEEHSHRGQSEQAPPVCARCGPACRDHCAQAGTELVVTRALIAAGGSERRGQGNWADCLE